MTISTQRFVIFMAISALLWLAFVPLYYAAFTWTEFVPGANWVYLPHGLRMILVLLFGLAGAFGFTLGAAILASTMVLIPGVPPLFDLLIAVIPGAAAYFAALLTIRDWPGRHLVSPWTSPVMAGRQLILLALVSAVLNAAGHAAVWAGFSAQLTPALHRFVAMFVGDFFGALLLLYILRGLMIHLEKTRKRSGLHGGTT